MRLAPRSARICKSAAVRSAISVTSLSLSAVARASAAVIRASTEFTSPWISLIAPVIVLAAVSNAPVPNLVSSASMSASLVVNRPSCTTSLASTASISDCRVSISPSAVPTRVSRAVRSPTSTSSSACSSVIAADRSVATVCRVAEPCFVCSEAMCDSLTDKRPF